MTTIQMRQVTALRIGVWPGFMEKQMACLVATTNLCRYFAMALKSAMVVSAQSATTSASVLHRPELHVTMNKPNNGRISQMYLGVYRYTDSRGSERARARASVCLVYILLAS